MQLTKNKTTTMFALFLMFAMNISLVALPLANAQFTYNEETQAAIDAGMNWDIDYQASSIRLLLWNRWQDKIPTFVYLVPSPNPVGAGQQVSFIMMNPQVPWEALSTNDIRYEYSLDITKPDGTTEHLPYAGEGSGVYTQGVKNGRFVSDSTGTAYTLYVPDQVGNYTITVTFHELYYRWNATSNMRSYYGVTFLESKNTVNLVVQNEPVVPEEELNVPLPTEYWTRPIEGQNTEWWRVASNWYNDARDRDNGGSRNAFQPDGTAPNSAHILWTKPTEDAGVVGGGNFSVPGEVFNAGHQYQTRMDSNGIIMNGKYYYLGPRGWGGEGDVYRAVDLRTGETQWEKELPTTTLHFGPYTFTIITAPSFGYLYDFDSMNQHGVTEPGYLFATSGSNWTAFHPLYGEEMGLTVYNVPSGFQVAGPKGEVIRYVLNSAGWLAQWNSSKALTDEVMSAYDSGERDASNAYDWNVSAPWRVGMTGGSITVRAAILGDVLLGSNGTHAVGTGAVTYHVPDEFTMWAVSLKPGEEGKLLWMKNIQTAGFPDNHVVQFRKAGEGVFTMIELPYQLEVGYSMYTGELLWKAETPIADFNPFGYYGYASLINEYYDKIAYGKLFVSGYSGMVFCYDLFNGTLLWRYEAPTGRTVFQYYTLFMGAIADGKLFIGTHEHSADTPLFKGNKVRAIDVNTGEEVWTMYGWAYPGTMAIADGTLVYWNNYDAKIYAVAKGPSATTVTASPKVSMHGDSVLVEGTVIDISAGTKQAEQAARFPYGVPAVSEDSMGAWMEYVYMQKPRPTDATGVNVTLTVLDPNGNIYDIGTVTSDADGKFKLLWEPLVPGEYTVTATFAGSEGYWPSYAETAVGVTPSPEASPEPTPTPAPMSELYFVPAVTGIIVAIAIVGALILLMLRKR